MSNLLVDVEQFATTLLSEKLNASFIYHNLTHTTRVIEKAKVLAEACKLNDLETEVLLISCWLHDTGYTKGVSKHEEASVSIARTFLESKKYAPEHIETVCKLIIATKLGHEPQTRLEKIIIDADCSHVGSNNYVDISELLRKEWELLCDKIYTESEWVDNGIDFLTKMHQFKTPEATVLWEKGKGKNLAKLLKMKKKLASSSKKIKQKKEELKFKKNKIELPERGIETMFRVTFRNHITLSNIADTKANILLSVNAIIVSLVLANLIPKLDNPSNKYLIIPTLIFVLVTVASIILSVLATRPNVTSGKFTKQDVANKKVNLLFFGNFHKMSLDDFEWAMGEMIQDRDYLYSSMKKDLYFLGLVLDKKYKILRLTYSVFMIGIIVSVIAFTIAFQMSGLV
ncbi:phosphohydrolase [Tamlana nanhaiensis]|uniref:Phosphohydrolase n=1 Tax=Neotamlana nanhaiensis TaxID=1382798 RepID=A0A0D7VXK9_9FLAO|nr:Pycsar system effector family protein [Tamlana nanhaiensis]KJD31586.1 phosphohydrolase [Tamlana nanhaiensis]